jgi:predicted esterase
LVLNVGELARQRSLLEGFSKDDQLAKDVRAGLPSALFHLETVGAFLAQATPFEDVADAATGIERVREAVADLQAGRPVFAGRRGVFRHAHRSAIDGTLQPYSVAIPDNYDAGREYPLLVMLHGSGVDERDVIYDAAALGAGRLNWIGMAPKARGLSDWYLGDSGRDVFECIEDVRKRYSIDSRCIVLMGFSSGGFGAWRLGLQRPELFAGVVPLSAPLAVRGQSVEPLLHKVEGLPLFVAHGTGDHAVSVEQARRAVGILRDRGYTLLTYHELEGAGHGNYNAQILPDLIAWLRAREPGR